MGWYASGRDANPEGPLSEDEVRSGVASGRFVAVRREDQEQWRPVAETVFRSLVPKPRFADLTPKQAQKVIRDAVSSGVLVAGLLLWLLGGLVWFFVVMLFGGR